MRIIAVEVCPLTGATVAYEVPGVDRIVDIDQARGMLAPGETPP